VKHHGLAFLLLPMTVLALRAADFAWPGNGVISLVEPAGWSLQGRPAGNSAYNFKCVPQSGANAEVLITLANTPPDHPLDEAGLKKILLDAVRPQLATMVEKTFSPQALAMHQGCGWFVQLTDASLVGKPPVRGNYKIMRSAMLALDEHALVIATMLFDDPDGPEAPAMLALVQSMRFRRAPASDSIAISEKDGSFFLTVPRSRVVLSFPKGDLALASVKAERGTASPRYFYLQDRKTGLNVSGWFEPAEKFEGLTKLWARDKARLVKAGVPIPQDESFVKVGEWEVVFYTITAGDVRLRAKFLNCRADCVRNGTWIDLHLSAPMSETAQNQLTGFLRAARIESKP
jgi:hypothetical protein